MLMPDFKKLSLKEYWSTDELLNKSIFRKIMARDRYIIMLLQTLHFKDNITTTDDPLAKIRLVINKIKTSFSQSFIPYENLGIDESLLLYKGRCFKQFIPSKRNRFGTKSFVLCDSKTGYIIRYTGLYNLFRLKNKCQEFY